MTKQYYVVSDIHGNFDELYRKTHHLPSKSLIFLGDYVDGFFLEPNATQKTLEYVKNRVQDGALALLGNHDDAFVKVLDAKNERHLSDIQLWVNSQGGHRTLLNLNGQPATDTTLRIQEKAIPVKCLTRWDACTIYEWLLEHDTIKPLVDWLATLPLSDHKRLIPHCSFVHAGYALGRPHAEQSRQDQLWIREAHYMRQKRIHSDFRNTLIVSGHTPTSTIHGNMDGKPYYRHLKHPNTGLLVIDAGSNGNPYKFRPNLNVVTLTIDADHYHIQCEDYERLFYVD